jgi:hypothetical protein
MVGAEDSSKLNHSTISRTQKRSYLQGAVDSRRVTNNNSWRGCQELSPREPRVRIQSRTRDEI